MAEKKIYINGVEISAKLIPDLTALTAVQVTDTTKKSIPVADEDSPNNEAKKMLLSELATLIGGSGSFSETITQISDDYNLLTTDVCIIIDSTSNAIDINFPIISSSNNGKTYTLRPLAIVEAVTLYPNGTDKILSVSNSELTSLAISNVSTRKYIADNTHKYWITIQ